MITELLILTKELEEVILQFGSFIDKFNTLIIEKNVNVISDSSGCLSIDVPYDMPSKESDDINKRINVIDRLIESHDISIKDYFRRAFIIENKLRAEDPNYVSDLIKKRAEFYRLRNSYKHFH
jgi:hypothetical protein